MRHIFPLATHVFLAGNHISTEQRDEELDIAREKRRRRHLRNLSEEILERSRGRRRRDNRAIYTRKLEDKLWLTLAAAYIIRERNYLYEYKLQGQD